MASSLRRLAAPLSLALAGCHAAASSSDAGVDASAPFVSTCTAGALTADAQRTAGRQADGSVILPGGRALTPVGRVLSLGGFPLGMKLLPGDRYAVVTDGAEYDEALRVIDLEATDPAHAVVSQVAYPSPHGDASDPNLFYGLALTRDGSRLYVSTGGYDPDADGPAPVVHENPIHVYDVSVDGKGVPSLVKDDALTIALAFDTGASGTAPPQERLPAGLALSSDGTLLYVAAQGDDTLAIVSLAPGPGYGGEIGRASLPGLAPYDVAVDEASHTAFVSLWGGDRLGPNQFVDGVVAVDVSDPTTPLPAMAPIETGKAAEAELLLAGKLYVANADADTVSIVDVASRAVKSLPVSAAMILGASPSSLAIDEARGRLYVADAGEDAVVALDLATLAVLGKIPTGWYPTAVVARADGSLAIASAKGLGAGATMSTDDPARSMQGIVQVVPLLSDADLAAGAEQVDKNVERPHAGEAPLACPDPSTGQPATFPLPPQKGAKTPIEHVFVIVRENKTYDADLGDLAGANGDPSLVLWPEKVTPNLHALARRFANLDNFYSQAEASTQGHQWTAAAIANDYTEKAWLATDGRGYRPLTAFAAGPLDHLALPGSDTIWTHLDRAGLGYHNYGEINGTGNAAHGLDPTYPGLAFNLTVDDVDKAAFVIANLQDPTFALEPFSYVCLPDDHTYGTDPGRPTPASMIADNDEATGRFIDALSRSPWWPTSIVFLVEDDPNGGGDHVDSHRSIGLVISPWVKRGYVSHGMYDLPSVYRTVERILGLDPMNLYDAHAAAMVDVFATAPDLEPFTFIPPSVPPAVNAMDAPLAEESARIDWSQPDTAPLGRILWKSVHGAHAEPPWHTDRAAARLDRDDD